MHPNRYINLLGECCRVLSVLSDFLGDLGVYKVLWGVHGFLFKGFYKGVIGF